MLLPSHPLSIVTPCVAPLFLLPLTPLKAPARPPWTHRGGAPDPGGHIEADGGVGHREVSADALLWEARLKDVVKGLDRIRGLLRAEQRVKDKSSDTLDPDPVSYCLGRCELLGLSLKASML